MLESRSSDKQFNPNSATDSPSTLDQAPDLPPFPTHKIRNPTAYRDDLNLTPSKDYTLGQFWNFLDRREIHLDAQLLEHKMALNIS